MLRDKVMKAFKFTDVSQYIYPAPSPGKEARALNDYFNHSNYFIYSNPL